MNFPAKYFVFETLLDSGWCVEASNVINLPKCNKGPKCNKNLVLNVKGPKCNTHWVLNVIKVLNVIQDWS